MAGGTQYVPTRTNFIGQSDKLVGPTWQLLQFLNGFRNQRVTTGSIAGGSSALVTLTWSKAFPDTNYTVAASVLDSTAATAALSVMHIETITKTAVAVRVQNTAVGALTGTLHVIALHD